MAKTVNIVDGVGTESLINGSYNVTADVTGYNNASLLPSTINVVDGTNTYDFTIAATGTLTLHVTEDGTSAGTPVVGATFVRTDADGNEYGASITTDASGDAVFNNVPFAATGAPLVYFKQLNSDGDHEFSTSVQSITLTESATTSEVQNAVGATRTLNITDANYANLPIASGTLTLDNEV